MQTDLITLHILDSRKKPLCGAKREGRVRFVKTETPSRKGEIWCLECAHLESSILNTKYTKLEYAK